MTANGFIKLLSPKGHGAGGPRKHRHESTGTEALLARTAFGKVEATLRNILRMKKINNRLGNKQNWRLNRECMFCPFGDGESCLHVREGKNKLERDR